MALKFKLLRRRLSISAPRMTVRTHLPWPLRLTLVTAGVVLLVVLAYFIYEEGRRFAGFGRDLSSELAELRVQNTALAAERDRYAAAATEAESRLNIERATQEQLGNQIKSLEAENAKLKDDVAFFDNLSTNTPVSAVTIKGLQVEADSVPQQMHYRFLVTRGGGGEHDFVGELQVIVTLQQAGKAVIINLPDGAPGTDVKAFAIDVRFFKRIEGTFSVPAGASVKRVEARVLEKGVVRAQQSVMVG